MKILPDINKDISNPKRAVIERILESLVSDETVTFSIHPKNANGYAVRVIAFKEKHE